MSLSFLIALTVLTSPAHAWNPREDAKKLGQTIKREAEEFGNKTKAELENARRDAERALAGPFEPLSRELAPGQGPGDDVEWIAVLGDSSVTGAVASPRFHVTVERTGQMLGDLVRGKHDDKLEARVEDFKDPARFNIFAPIDTLTRVLYTRAEFDEASRGVQGLKHRVGSAFSEAFDTEEYAFPYLIGRALNVPAPRIVLAAQDGRKISAMNEQLLRIMSVPNVTRLPPLVIASFVANDLCHPDNFDQPIDHFVGTYAREVSEQFEALAKYPAAERGTRVVVVAPLDVASLLTNEKLLDQHVQFENARDATCRSIHDGSAVHGDVAKKLQTFLTGACRGILRSDGNSVARVARVRDLQTEQLRILREAVTAFNARGLGTRAEMALSTRDLTFETGDLAHDCFHPSPHGHERIADILLRTTFAR